jgi:hypothetical protein
MKNQTHFSLDYSRSPATLRFNSLEERKAYTAQWAANEAKAARARAAYEQERVNEMRNARALLGIPIVILTVFAILMNFITTISMN